MTMDLVTSGGGELDLQSELEETEKSLREVTLMIEQSQGEVLKLSQRNAAITTHLQQVQNQFEKCLPRKFVMLTTLLWMPSKDYLSCADNLRSCRTKNHTWNVSNLPLNVRG